MDYRRLKIWSESYAQLQAKIDAIYQDGNLINLIFKGAETLHFVLESSDAFAFFDEHKIEQKHQIWGQLRHARLKKIELEENDRILTLSLELQDIYGQKREFLLIAELIPPRPNLILCEIQDQQPVVLDAIHKYSLADNPARQILPNLVYQAPPGGWQPKTESTELSWELKHPPSGELISYEDPNLWLKDYHRYVILAQKEEQSKRQQLSHWKKAIQKLEKKMALQLKEAEGYRNRETWRLYAEVIKYNLLQMDRGQTELVTTNYLCSEMGEIRIPLKPELSPRQNMEYYLKLYKKADRGMERITALILNGSDEKQRMQEIIARIEGGEDLSFLLSSPKDGKSGNERLGKLDKLLRIRIDEKYEIVIGRKATENDFISTQLGKPHDWWFHTRIFRGAHVLLRCFQKTNPSDELKTICCRLAAWFSKARFSTNIPVDYTQVRYLRKPRHTAAGFITYSDYQTAFVDPLEPRQAREELGL